MPLMLGEEAWDVIAAMTMVFLLMMPLPIEQGLITPCATGAPQRSVGRP
jgi:hypothetical protein